MGVVVDFDNGLQALLDELEETYDGRILSPQGKVIRVMPLALREKENSALIFYGHVYVTTLMYDEIYQALLGTAPIEADGDHDEKWLQAHEELNRLTSEIEQEISGRGFIIRRGRYIFRGDSPHITD